MLCVRVAPVGTLKVLDQSFWEGPVLRTSGLRSAEPTRHRQSRWNLRPGDWVSLGIECVMGELIAIYKWKVV